MQYTVLGVALVISIAGGAFYGGMQYEKSIAAKVVPAGRNFAGGTRQGGNLPGKQNNGNAMRQGGQNGGGFVAGEILSKDDKSLTIKTRDGGSSIVYFAPTLMVRKADAGSLTDLAIGQQVMVSGKTNADGTLSADTVSISPEENK